jgi:DHA1 family bicyclomycin/chloramphenicol resistance-like MFS transporter
MDTGKRKTLIFVLGSLTAIGPFSIDMYLPGFPVIARDLGTDISHVTLTLTSYFIGISLGQLVYGPLLDRFGRRRPLIIGLTIYVASAAGCGLSPSLEVLVVMRFFLAIGACVGIVAARAIVRDLFPSSEIAKVFSTLMLILGVSPIIAPSVGATVTDALGWRYIFLVLGVIGVLITIFVVRFLPESRHSDATVSLHPLSTAASYLRIMRDPVFLVFGAASAATSAGLFAYISDSPFVMMNLFGLTEHEFGLVFSLIGFGIIGSSQINRLWLRRQDSARIAWTTIRVQLLAGALLLTGLVAGTGPALTIALMFLYFVGNGFLGPNTTAIAIEPFTANAGSAAALMGSIQMGASALGSAAVGFFHDGTAIPMAGILMFSSLTSFGLQFAHRRRTRAL